MSVRAAEIHLHAPDIIRPKTSIQQPDIDLSVVRHRALKDSLAQTFSTPATIHDCTGPLTLFAHLHLAASSANLAFQETVRAHIRSFYDKLVDTLPVIDHGKAHLPAGPGFGTKLREDFFRLGVNSYRRSKMKA